MKLTMMCGLPNSGKTTKAAALARETGAALVTWDEHARRVGKVLQQDEIREAVVSAIRAALEDGRDVVYDAVNATAEERKRIAEACTRGIDGVQTACMFMDTPVDICMPRDRFGWARAFARFFRPPTEDEGFGERIVCRDGIGGETE